MVIGGTRSGKSEVAERIAAAAAADPGATAAPFVGVTVVVPASVDDAGFATRVARHRARRPADWATVECGAALVDALRAATGVVLVDSLGSWVAASPDLAVDVDGLVDALRDRTAPTVLVAEEVGLAVHPPTDLGRRFGDALGELNAAVAAVADEVFLVVAGRRLALEP
jgi:adenosyl cobinamide kinase/adenosyl cobinamide phosphate guanylyltransferase